MAKKEKEPDIYSHKFTILVKKVNILQLRKVKIKDNPFAENGHVDIHGGEYIISNPTRVYTESILAGSPMQTSIGHIDEAIMNEVTMELVSLNEICNIYENTGDIKFPYLDQVINMEIDARKWKTWVDNKRVNSIHHDYGELNDIYILIEKFINAVTPIAAMVRANNKGSVAADFLSNAFGFSSKEHTGKSKGHSLNRGLEAIGKMPDKTIFGG